MFRPHLRRRGTMGLGRLYLRGGPTGVWWLAIGLGGRKYRFSTKLRGGVEGKPPREVELWRARKLAELGQTGAAGLRAEVVTVGDILDMLLVRWEAEGRTASLRVVRSRIKVLREGLGSWRAQELKADRILSYAVERKKAGAAVATVNMELRLLSRSYRVAIDAGRLVYAPKVPHLPGSNVRRGHVPDEMLAAIRAKLPKWASDAVWFLRLTGWRLQEGLGLEWRRVDFEDQCIRLETSKTGEPRVLSFRNYADLKRLMEDLRSARGLGPYVFVGPRGGRVSACTLRGLWDAACADVGLPGAILHDLRRSMVRAMDRAGVPRSVAMSITGHKSEAVYRQYGLFDSAMQDVALASLTPDTTVVPIRK
jgi:integrase